MATTWIIMFEDGCVLGNDTKAFDVAEADRFDDEAVAKEWAEYIGRGWGEKMTVTEYFEVV